jgi:hypothetical protein
VIPALALSVVAVILVVVYLRVRGTRSSQDGSPRQSRPDKFDTTLGEFRDMREALRPLGHARAASRRNPGEGK